MAILTHFADPHLMRIAEVFCVNSRCIKKHACWHITRSEQVDDGERLHAHADAFGGLLDLIIWDDGAILFDMAKGYRDGAWDWELRFHGDASEMSPETVLDLFINSITSPRSNLMALWEPVQPFVEYGRRRSARQLYGPVALRWQGGPPELKAAAKSAYDVAMRMMKPWLDWVARQAGPSPPNSH